MSQIRWPVVLVIGLLIGAGVAWYIEGLRWAADVATIQAANSADITLIANTATAASNAALTKQKAAEAAISANDAKYTQELADAKDKLASLQRGVDNGSIGLHVAAKCPARSDAVPNGSGPPGGDNATAPRLTDAAQRNYFILRERIEIAANQILALQAYIDSITLHMGAASE